MRIRPTAFRSLGAAAIAAVFPAALGIAHSSAQAQEPIKIGYSMALTGGLGPNGQSALLAQKIWEEDINAKGGLLGRPVKLIYYDDQSNPSTVPGIYAKLLDVDKVDLIIGGYATNMLAPAMPLVIQRKKMFIGLLGLAVNSEFHYPNYFVITPGGPEPKLSFTKGFFDVAVAQNPKPTTVAIISADAEFARNAADGARENAARTGLKIVYDKTYPPPTADFAPIVRGDRGDQSRHRRDLLLSARLRRHGARGQRDRLQAEDDRRRHGRPAEHLDQDAAGAAAQRLHQLRLLAARAEDAGSEASRSS